MPKGALLCKQGSRADSMLVLLRGRAAVYVDKRGKATEGHNWPAAMSPGESSHRCCCTPLNLRVFRLYNIPVNTYVNISIRSMTLAVSMPARLSGQKHAARTLRKCPRVAPPSECLQAYLYELVEQWLRCSCVQLGCDVVGTVTLHSHNSMLRFEVFQDNAQLQQTVCQAHCSRQRSPCFPPQPTHTGVSTCFWLGLRPQAAVPSVSVSLGT